MNTGIDDGETVRYAVARELERMNVSTKEDHRHESASTVTPTKNRADALSTVAYAATAFALAVGSYVYVNDREHDREQISDLQRRNAIQDGTISGLQADVEGLRIDATKYEQRQIAHDDTAKFWIEHVKAIRTEQITNTKAIALFQRDANSRYDPFTGTEGRELETRIKAVERCCGKLEDNQEDLGHEHK